MSSRLALLIGSLALLSFTSCGKPPMETVEGTVLLDGKPIANCKVGFFPDVEKFDPNRSGFGYGITNEAGKYSIQHPSGEAGIWSGKYKVTFVAWVDQNGKALSVDTKPSEVEGGVRNRFPDIYEAPSTTPERVTVNRNSQKTAYDFSIETKK